MRPHEKLNGRERRKKKRAEPITKVNGRREAEREREEKTNKQPKQPDKHAGANTHKGQTTRTRARTERERKREKERQTTTTNTDRRNTNQIIQVSNTQTYPPCVNAIRPKRYKMNQDETHALKRTLT